MGKDKFDLGYLPVPEKSGACGIYVITHAETGRSYVGSSVDIRVRVRHHKSFLRKNLHRNPHLQAVWNKRGEEALVFGVLELCDHSELHDRENQWIARLNALTPNGFNLCAVAGTMRGFKHPLSFGEAIRARKAGQKMHPNSLAALIAYHTGREQTPETKRKRAAAMRLNATTRPGRAWQTRQMQIMFEFGRTAAAIARELGVSPKTVARRIPGQIANRNKVNAMVEKK